MSVAEPFWNVDILGQQPGLRLYTQLTLCYALNIQDVYPRLSKGLEQVAQYFPRLAGKVVQQGAGEGTTGVFKVVPSDNKIPLVVKDLRQDPSMATFADLESRNFPISKLDENLIAPRTTVPSAEDLSKDWPVFMVQATLVQGGLLLTFNGQHQAMDMAGLRQSIELLDRACRCEEFTPQEIEVGNMDATPLVPSLDELPHTDRAETATGQQATSLSQPRKVQWVNFSISGDHLKELKGEAINSLQTGFVSTDDVLTAFVWQAVMRARLPRLNPQSKCTITRAVDMRRFFNVPAEYTGLLQDLSFVSQDISILVNEPLGKVAQQFRSKLVAEKLVEQTRAFATQLRQTPDKNSIRFVGKLDLSRDITLSSWVKEEALYSLDFGMGLGKPVSVRRPRMVPLESLFYFLPKAPNGDVVIALCLRDDDIQRLRNDINWSNYASYIG